MHLKIILIFLISSYAFCCSQHDLKLKCANNLSNENVLDLTNKLIEKHFPDILKVQESGKLTIQLFEDDDYYLKTMFKPFHIFKKRKNRSLILYINDKLFNCSPSLNAMKSILVHELFHLQDYLDYNSLKLVGLGFKMILKSSRSKYERRTDLKTMKLGYALGLIEYRQWIYSKLNSKQLKTKKRLYYTPLEIKDWISHQNLLLYPSYRD